MRGMSMIGWPTYMEQRMNRVFTVEKMGVALPLDDMDDEFVVAVEEKNWVKLLLFVQDGNNDFRHKLTEEFRKRGLMVHGETGESVMVSIPFQVTLQMLTFLDFRLSDLRKFCYIVSGW
ncbi:UDP-glycosyltransferase 88A1 [Striga hermonthica]|uniref:UDP-glycosyltransferase 88A1 n=1 Tax=Striga hermonthica TaxID=68872 RepID=A0A9N7NCJ9_STRHE|nr:UDP-glycosyltransferase 88A1 [Striga hermonthica]